MGWEIREMLAAMDDTAEIYLDRVSQADVAQWSKGRTVLIGDAAACPSLLAGEGTGLAMTEAYVLAGELAASGGDILAAFDAYEKRLRPFIEEKQKSARAFASLIRPEDRVRNLAAQHGHASHAHPACGRLARWATRVKDDFDLPDYGI
jgi:2-polyprenyl-6-methoxyphenol hydroxylase-like FAD-dependent oxidoreductase